mgnify:CR=1 FL=1|jgi:predicted kinase
MKGSPRVDARLAHTAMALVYSGATEVCDHPFDRQHLRLPIIAYLKVVARRVLHYVIEDNFLCSRINGRKKPSIRGWSQTFASPL